MALLHLRDEVNPEWVCEMIKIECGITIRLWPKKTLAVVRKNRGIADEALKGFNRRFHESPLIPFDGSWTALKLMVYLYYWYKVQFVIYFEGRQVRDHSLALDQLGYWTADPDTNILNELNRDLYRLENFISQYNRICIPTHNDIMSVISEKNKQLGISPSISIDFYYSKSLPLYSDEDDQQVAKIDLNYDEMELMIKNKESVSVGKDDKNLKPCQLFEKLSEKLDTSDIQKIGGFYVDFKVDYKVGLNINNL